jgi:replicative DNA helicase
MTLPDLSNTNAPYSPESEEAVIGAVLVNPSSFMTVSAFLQPEDFFLLRHQYIWQAMYNIQERREIIDHLTVSEELANLGFLEEIGGRTYLIQLINNTPSSIYAETYGRLVERTALRRKLLKASDKIRQLAMDESINVDSVMSEAEAQIFNVSDTQTKREFVPMWEALSAYYDRMEYMLQNKRESLGVPSGFRDLDKLLGGFQKSDLIVFAGRPGMGKTSWLLTVAINAARAGQRVAIFTMEMGVEQMVQRLVAMESGINVQDLRLANLSTTDQSRFTEVIGRISEYPIFIDDTPAMSPMEMRTKCRRLQHEYGLDMIIVDYMQLMNAGKAYENNRVQEISFISRNMKELARELNVPLISAAQLSRAVEQRQDKRPVLSDLRESGSIEQDSDIVMFLVPRRSL